MHARILLPSIVAATLLSTAAWADRNDSDDRTPNRTTVKERIVKESRTREATERVQTKKDAPAKARSERAAPQRLAEKRGCTTEDGGSCSAKSERTTKTASTKSHASMPSMPARLQAMRGCSTEDGSGCTVAEKKQRSESKSSSDRHLVEKTNRTNQQLVDQMMKMRLQIEGARMLDMLKIQSCKRHGSCTEDAY